MPCLRRKRWRAGREIKSAHLWIEGRRRRTSDSALASRGPNHGKTHPRHEVLFVCCAKRCCPGASGRNCIPHPSVGASPAVLTRGGQLVLLGVVTYSWQSLPRITGIAGSHRLTVCVMCEDCATGHPPTPGGVGRCGDQGSIRRGGGSETQNFVYRKWPDQISPMVYFVFPHYGHFGGGGGGGSRATPPPLPHLSLFEKGVGARQILCTAK